MWTKCFFLVVEEGLEEVFLVEDALSFREEERDQVVEAMPFGPPPAEDAAAADRADDSTTSTEDGVEKIFVARYFQNLASRDGESSNQDQGFIIGFLLQCVGLHEVE